MQAGDVVADFTLQNQDGVSVSLSDFAAKPVVLFFYPRDGTPYCTLEAADFSDHENEFARLDCVILGVSRDDCLSHADFRDKHGLSVRLLSDQEGEVCRKYGVSQFREKEDGHGWRRGCG